MRITLKVCAKARQNKVEGPLQDGSYKIHTQAPPVDGAANAAVCELLAKHFGVPKSKVSIVLGQTNNHKVAELPDP